MPVCCFCGNSVVLKDLENCIRGSCENQFHYKCALSEGYKGQKTFPSLEQEVAVYHIPCNETYCREYYHSLLERRTGKKFTEFKEK